MNSDSKFMQRAYDRANFARLIAPPNPWVGAVLVTLYGTSFEGHTQRPGQNHAEAQVLEHAGPQAKGATLFVTLEPCCIDAKTPPCVNKIINSGISRVVIGVQDTDPRVSGRGIELLREAGVEVTLGVLEDEITSQLKPYLYQRRTGLPFVIMKLAASLDGKIAAPDNTSKWITGPEARQDVQNLRAQSDAILVGAKTVQIDDPGLRILDINAPDGQAVREPLRCVLGKAKSESKINPCLEYSGDITEMLKDLASKGVLQLMVEGGAGVAGGFFSEDLVDCYVFYYAPAIFASNSALPMFNGENTGTIDSLRRGTIDSVVTLGSDIRVTYIPDRRGNN